MVGFGLGSAMSSFAGVTTLLTAFALGSEGDTFSVMQAVLDTQFWLSTHVVSITIGYAGTLVAALLGIAWLLMSMLIPRDLTSSRKTVAKMVYGVTCLSLIFSFVGTGSWRTVGRRFLGTILGMGRERKWRSDDRAGKRCSVTRSLGRSGERSRNGDDRHPRWDCHALVVVCRQRTRDWSAHLRFDRRTNANGRNGVGRPDEPHHGSFCSTKTLVGESCVDWRCRFFLGAGLLVCCSHLVRLVPLGNSQVAVLVVAIDLKTLRQIWFVSAVRSIGRPPEPVPESKASDATRCFAKTAALPLKRSAGVATKRTIPEMGNLFP